MAHAHDAATPRMLWSSDRTLLVRVGDRADAATSERVRAACGAIRAAGFAGLVDVTPAYASVMLTFNIATLRRETWSGIDSAVRELLRDSAAHRPRHELPARVIEIPVCYDAEFAPDLGEVARRAGVSIERAIELHTSPDYTAAFLGFAPGFAYLLGLPAELATPRLDAPRVRVPAGSVGIAGTQTGVYPRSTPGGWRLIGRTPLVLFDATRDPASTLAQGNRVRFMPITRARFGELASRAGGAS